MRSLWQTLFPVGIPLAWCQLVAEKKRFLAAVAGITFAVTMMMFQMGLNSALFTQVVSPHLKMRGDIVLVGPQYEYFGISRGFPKQRLTQALAFAEVENTMALYLGNLPIKNPDSGVDRDVLIIAFDPSERPFSDADIEAQQYRLQRDGAVLFDVRSREEFGRFAELLETSPEGVASEVSGRMVSVEGLFEMGITFAADGNILMSYATFEEVWPGAHPDSVSVGLIELSPGADRVEMAAALSRFLPDDILVLTMEEFIEKEKDYWANRTPIGFVITASMIVALIVGAVIVYQILYTDVTDHLPEYATLKSIGFRDRFFVFLIMQESIILSVFGFLPGLGLTALLYYLTRTMAYMPTYLTPGIVITVFVLTLGMCVVAGGLATRKLRHANPADIF